MRVKLIAYTALVPWDDQHEDMRALMDSGGSRYSEDADVLAEFAGRSCYQSFHKPNPATSRNADYLANIIEQGHFSVFEHASATFYVEGISRSLTHELIRHRHLSYSQLSQRFVDEVDAELVVPPAIRDLGGEPGQRCYEVLSSAFTDSLRDYDVLVQQLQSAGLGRKQAREAARAVLPNATETKLVVTGNLRAWREVITKRGNEHADAEIQEFAEAILFELRMIAPGQVQDFGHA